MNMRGEEYMVNLQWIQKEAWGINECSEDEDIR